MMSSSGRPHTAHEWKFTFQHAELHLHDLRRAHRSRIEPEGRGITGLGMEPTFGIGQRALHVRSAGGGVIWDCTSLVDEASVAKVRSLGGARAMAISHP